ncbi:uncharacterized protein LOC121405926 [Lytechinus variegatus]|uniref:uncharacterized protein LOC121405926 n=1 Tax=Lytechinus variegatus TaxID=7654 RepID=UPI001BB16CB8|nr:uncharacterized protein LOC121405926 [Lytechinus variegatus]XP_041452857.1 uncharacterized protein LOC121405926 [Lytechinus variegatus]
MVSARTSSAIFILLCSVVHSAMAYRVYYDSWYLYVWIPFCLIIAIIRGCCYYNRKREPEQRIVYVEGVPADQTQTTTIDTTQVTAGSGVVLPPEQAPPYGQHQGPVINSAYTPGPGNAYPPQNQGVAMYPPASGANAAYPPPPGYVEAVKLPNYQSS